MARVCVLGFKWRIAQYADNDLREKRPRKVAHRSSQRKHHHNDRAAMNDAKEALPGERVPAPHTPHTWARDSPTRPRTAFARPIREQSASESSRPLCKRNAASRRQRPSRSPQQVRRVAVRLAVSTAQLLPHYRTWPFLGLSLKNEWASMNWY